jgi:hypothetical protein
MHFLSQGMIIGQTIWQRIAVLICKWLESLHFESHRHIKGQTAHPVPVNATPCQTARAMK